MAGQRPCAARSHFSGRRAEKAASPPPPPGARGHTKRGRFSIGVREENASIISSFFSARGARRADGSCSAGASDGRERRVVIKRAEERDPVFFFLSFFLSFPVLYWRGFTWFAQVSRPFESLNGDVFSRESPLQCVWRPGQYWSLILAGVTVLDRSNPPSLTVYCVCHCSRKIFRGRRSCSFLQQKLNEY